MVMQMRGYKRYPAGGNVWKFPPVDEVPINYARFVLASACITTPSKTDYTSAL